MDGRRRGDLLIAFGDTVRRHRKDRGLSQEQLAERAGLHRNYIQSLEHGQRNVSLVSVVALADALDVPVCALIEPALPVK